MPWVDHLRYLGIFIIPVLECLRFLWTTQKEVFTVQQMLFLEKSVE